MTKIRIASSLGSLERWYSMKTIIRDHANDAKAAYFNFRSILYPHIRKVLVILPSDDYTTPKN